MELFTVNGVYICKARKGITMQKFEEALKNQLAMRKGSFAEHYSLKIFRNLFQYAHDLRQEYEEYYCEEYDSFSEFLYKKELWEKSNIRDAALADGDTVLKLHIQSSSYNMETLLDYDDSVLSMIIRTLEGIDL